MNLSALISPQLTPIYITTDFNWLGLILFTIYINIKERKPTLSRYIKAKMEVAEKTEPCCGRYYSLWEMAWWNIKGKKAFVQAPESGGAGRATKRGESSVWKAQRLLGRQDFLFGSLTKISALPIHCALRHGPSHALLCLGSGLLYNQGETEVESIFLYNIRHFQKGACQPRWKSDTLEEGAHSWDSGEETKLRAGQKLLSAHLTLWALLVRFGSKPSKWLRPLSAAV